MSVRCTRRLMYFADALVLGGGGVTIRSVATLRHGGPPGERWGTDNVRASTSLALPVRRHRQPSDWEKEGLQARCAGGGRDSYLTSGVVSASPSRHRSPRLAVEQTKNSCREPSTRRVGARPLTQQATRPRRSVDRPRPSGRLARPLAPPRTGAS